MTSSRHLASLSWRSGAHVIHTTPCSAQIPAGINYEDYILLEALEVNDNLVTLSNVTELLSASGHHLNFTTQGVEVSHLVALFFLNLS